MSKATEASHHRTRSTISLVACILLGFILFLAGSGKIFGFGDMPGQTMLFLLDTLPDAFLKPWIIFFLSEILLPYIIPCAELFLGIFLLLHIWPRLMATISLPLIIAFIANNVWYISLGEALKPCDCWGIWAKILGTPTHLQSLWVDIVLLALALIIIFMCPGGFMSSPPWLAKLGQGGKGKTKKE